MKPWLQSLAVLALFSTSTQALQLNPSVNSTITVNACKYKKTNNSFDMALINRGFFVISRGEYGQLFYTRHGQFKLNEHNELITGAKDKLMSGSILERESLSPIKIPTDNLSPLLTREVTYGLNLPTHPPTDASYHVASAIYDRAGGTHVLEQYYTKKSTFVWEVSIEIDEQVITKGKLSFDEYGMVDIKSSINSVNWVSAYGEQFIRFDFSKVTQFGEPFAIYILKQDGYSVGSLVAIDITPDGYVELQYSNRRTLLMNQRISVATFDRPELLTPIVENLYMPNSESGEANIYPDNGNGVFLPGYLEEKFCLPDM